MDGAQAEAVLNAGAARFGAGLDALVPPAEPLALAVSGGPDSLALLVLAQRARTAPLFAVTVDHGLRAAAAGEAAMVAKVCASLGVAHRTLRIDLEGGSGVQARAREARYGAIAGWMRAEGLGTLVTAHHADDQAETMVMRLNRGAGVRGLAAMRAAARVPGAPMLVLLRPLLGWRRAELAEVCEAAGLTPADDPSNRDEQYERVRVRAGLASADWIDPIGLAASAARLADADAGLEWATDREWELVAQGPAEISYRPAAPRAVRLRVLERVIAAIGEGVPRGAELARWLAVLESGSIATLARVRGDGREVPWRFTRAPAHRE